MHACREAQKHWESEAGNRQTQYEAMRQIIRFNTQHESAEDRSIYPRISKVVPEDVGSWALKSHAQLMDEVSSGYASQQIISLSLSVSCFCPFEYTCGHVQTAKRGILLQM